jgi:hypothetical protein
VSDYCRRCGGGRRYWLDGDDCYHEAPLIDEAPRTRRIYIIGSMRNPRVPEVAKALRAIGWDAFDDWYSVGPEADDKWQEYERARGRTFREALAGHHAQHAFALDRAHLERCDLAVLVAPAGKSGHLELGWVLGQGKPGYILMDGEPERYDLMYLFATAIFMSVDEMLERLK